MRKITFFILCLEAAVLSFNVAACSAIIPSISKEFAAPQFITGRMIWLYMLPYGIAALLYGPLARTFDARNIKLVCFGCFSLSSLLAGLSRNIHFLFTARILMGIFGASVIPLALILIGRQFEGSRRGRSVGLFFGTTFTASLAGLFLSGIIYWRLIFLIPALFGFMTCIVIYFYLPSFKPDLGSLKFSYLSVFKDDSIIRIFTYIFLISLFYHSIRQWLGVYFSLRYEFSQMLISMLITLTSLSGVFGELFGGWSADRFGRIKTINAGVIAMIVSAFLLMFKMPAVGLGIIMVFWGLGWTFNHAGISTILTDLPKEFLNEAASLNSSVRFIAGGLGVVLSGLLMQKNFNLGFSVFAACLLSLLLFTKRLVVKT